MIEIQGYCLKCKAKVIIKDPEQSINKRGQPFVKGKCSSCGSSVYRIISKKEGNVEENQSLGMDSPNQDIQPTPNVVYGIRQEQQESFSPPIQKPPMELPKLPEPDNLPIPPKPSFLQRLFKRKPKEDVEVLKEIPRLREIIKTSNPDGELVEISNKVREIDYDKQKKEGVYYF